MPSRTQFLSSSLVPSRVAIEATEECTICMSPYTKAVKIPCGHEFCEDCIVKWLHMKNKNTCPICKTELFVLSSDDDPDAVLRRAVVSALRTSGLTRLNNSEKEFETYGSDLYTISDLQRGTAHAMGYLVSGGQSVSHSAGRALVDISCLSAGFVAMGNMIQEFARASGREYTTQEKAGWKLVLTQLWMVLKDANGRRYDSLAIPTKMRSRVMEYLRETYSEADGIHPFFLEESRSADLDLMLNFLTSGCRSAYEAEMRLRNSSVPTNRNRLAGVLGRCAVM